MSDSIDNKLWVAAGNGDEALVSQCIEQGAEVDWRDEDNSTALHEAAYNGHTSVVIRLICAGWSLEARIRSGEFHRAGRGILLGPHL